MIEKIETGYSRRETDQEHPLVESLIAQLGVPAEGISTYLGGLCMALGQKNNPIPVDDPRVVAYLKFKIVIKMNRLRFLGVDRKSL